MARSATIARRVSASGDMAGVFSLLAMMAAALGGGMAAYNNEISSAEKVGLHLSEIGRMQNNAGSILQFMALMFAICVYFFNAYVFPATADRYIYASLLILDSAAMLFCCFLYLRCLTVSVGWTKSPPDFRRAPAFLSHLSEADIEKALEKIVRDFRRGSYCFFFSFVMTFLLLCTVAFGTVQKAS